MDSAGGYFSINGIPVLYFETDVQAQAIEKAWDTWLRMHTIKLRDLRDLLFMESTWLLSNEDSKGIRKVVMGKGKGWSKDDLKYITLNSKSLKLIKKMGTKSLQNVGPNPMKSSPNGAKRG